MRRWRFNHRWGGGATWPSDALVALSTRQELETIADRREWETTQALMAPDVAAQAVGTGRAA